MLKLVAKTTTINKKVVVQHYTAQVFLRQRYIIYMSKCHTCQSISDQQYWPWPLVPSKQ